VIHSRPHTKPLHLSTCRNYFVTGFFVLPSAGFDNDISRPLCRKQGAADICEAKSKRGKVREGEKEKARGRFPQG